MKHIIYRVAGFLLLAVLCLPLLFHMVYAGTTTGSVKVDDYVLDVSISCENDNDDDSCTVSGNVITAQATGTKRVFSFNKETKITLRNNSGDDILVSYTANLTNGSEDKKFTASSNSPLSISKNGGTATITISDKGPNTYNLTLTIDKIQNNTNWNVTWGASNNCTITDSNGNALPEKSTISAANGIALKVASVAAGYSCVGFADAAGNWVCGVDTNGNATFYPTADCTIYPILVNTSELPTSAPFRIGDAYYYLWESAFAAATSSPVVLAVAEYTLPTATISYFEPSNLQQTYVRKIESNIEYIVPIGTSFLVPYDEAGTFIKNDAEKYLLESDANKQLFSELIMPSNTQITVKGSIGIGSQSHRQMTGQAGPYGAITTEANSNITITSGGCMYAWGYIFGNGSVTANDGSTVYENLSVMDYPGGASTTQDIYNDKVFPLRAFTVRNVEIPMTFHHGAKEFAFYSLYGSNAGYHSGYQPFIGNSSASVFELTSNNSTLVKSYQNKKQCINFVGDARINQMSVSISFYMLVAIKVDVLSANTSGIPIPSGFDISVSSGTFTLNDNVVMMEGAKITIAEGATADLNSKNVYVMDATEDPGAKSGTDVHGNAYTVVNEDAIIDVNGTLNASGGFYTSTGGASITSSKGTGKIIISGNSTELSSSVDIKSSTATVSTISITPAKLLNGNGTYVAQPGTNNTYTYSGTGEAGRWVCETHSWDNCVCAVCSKAGIRYNSYYLDLQGQIYLTFTFTVEPGVDITDVYVHVTEEANKIDAQDSWYMPLSSVSKDDKGRYVISQGIAAGAMTGNVTVQFQIGSDPNAAPLTFFDGNSETGTSVVKTVKDYLQTAITSAQSSDTLKALCQAAAQFGGYAQQFYQTRLDDVVSSILGDYSKMPTADDFKNFLTKTDGSIDGVAATGQQVNLDSAVFLRVYFNVADPSAITSIQAGLNMVGVTLDEVELKTDDSGRYYVDVENIPVACWNDEYIISINNGEYTVTTSVMAWARSCIYLSNDTDQRLMAAAMFTFAKAADEYFYS